MSGAAGRGEPDRGDRQPGEPEPGERTVALWTMAVGGIAFVVLAAVLVPWHPVPGGDVRPVSATSVLSAEQISRAEEFARWARVWSWSSLLVSLVVACVLGFGPWGRRVVARLPGPWVVRAVLAVAGLVLVGRLVTLPFALAQQQHFLNSGLTRQAWSGYAVDMVKTELVDIVVTSIGVVAIIGCARRWRRAWPAVAGGLAAALVMLGSFVYPVVVEPLFNTFTALPDGSLRSDILELAAREHVHISDVEVADASRRTTTLNAYVTGFGATKRVVIYDTVVHDLTDSEILAIVSHELAHSRHDDVLVGSAIGAAGAAFGVGLLALVVGGVRRRPGEVADVGTVPLLLALMAIGSLLSSPVSNLISREIETRADVDGLLATRDPEAFIAMQVQLARHSLQDPTPPAWSQFWFGSHPTTLTRIAIAERLDGEPTSRNGGK